LSLARFFSARKGPKTARARLLAQVAAVVGGVAALSIVALPGAGTAHAASGLSYRQGLYLDNGWLCRGWSNGAYHCTHHWHRSRSGQVISDNPAWVPNGGAITTRSAARPATRGVTYSAPPPASFAPIRAGGGAEPCSPNVPSSVWTAVNFRAPGAIPPGCYGGVYAINPSRYVYRPYFGECNWWVEVLRPDEPTAPYDTRLPRGHVARVGATVFYAGYAHGASPTGHYGHVEAISPDGQWMMTSEMNMYWRGGGFGRVIYRYVPIDWTETFIY
jgi:hypothetical protein